MPGPRWDSSDAGSTGAALFQSRSTLGDLGPGIRRDERGAGMTRPWWKGALLYHVYVRSFFDSDGDGHGDLPGVEAKLDYIRSLGVDGIWLSPIHPSPNRDWGYDVADFEGIQGDYGTLQDFQHLLDAAHAKGLKA